MNFKKFIVRFIPLKLLLDLVAWKLHTWHNLREAAAPECRICASFFKLEKECEENQHNPESKNYIYGKR
jgi:hypothetical protein